MEHWLLLKQEGRQTMAPPVLMPGGQLPAVCVGPLQLRRDDGGVSQELVTRWLKLCQLKVETVETQAGA